MLISVIIPCYNSEKYLKNTVDSVLNQTYKNIEIILINDGSTDSTANIIKDFEILDSRVKSIYQNNKGVSVARNTGLKNVKGKYITFLDSDDTYEKNKIFEQVNKIRKTKSKVCICGNNYIFSNNKVQHINKFEGKILEQYLSDTTIHLNDFLIDSELIKSNNINFCENIKYGEDSNFIMKVLALSEVTSVKEILTNYFIRETSSSFDSKIRNNIEDNYIFDFEKFINNEKNSIYNQMEKLKIIEILKTFLLPQVVIRNFIFCKKNKKDLSGFENEVLRSFKFNTKNIKSSLNFYLMYVKILLRKSRMGEK